ncbi:MAG: alpha-1,3-rhamnosyltransferase [Sediminicola sp.]|jgi:alpha-1,3-rhamnosyltransferase
MISNLDYPLVSIVVPSYNHALYIEECIESIVNQDYPNFELIVIDDGSKDESPQILKKLQTKYGFLLEINANQGLSQTLNRGFRDLAKGKYFTFSASDDRWFPGKLSKQVAFLEENLDYAMVYGRAWYIDENGQYLEKDNKRKSLYTGGYIFDELILQKFHPPVNYMLRAEVISSLGYYREHIWAEDFDMNLRIADRFPIGFIDDYLSYYRINHSIPSKALNFKSIRSHRDSIELFKHKPVFGRAIKAWHYRNYLWYAPFSSGKKLAVKGLLKNLDLIHTEQFWRSLAVLIFKWHK